MPHVEYLTARTGRSPMVVARVIDVIPAKGWTIIGPAPSRLCYRVEREPVYDLDSRVVTVWVVPE